MLVFEPTGPPRAAVILFHGGGLRHGSPDELAPHCTALAAKGILAAAAGYRLLGQGAEHIGECLADVRAEMAKFRAEFRAESRKLAAPTLPLATGGSSAGGHLALLATLTGPDSGFDTLVLFNPIVDATLVAPEVLARALEPGTTAESISPLHLLRPGSPRTAVFSGTADSIAPIESLRAFRDAMVAAGDACELTEFEGAEHAFHYQEAYFERVLAGAVGFLTRGR
ncbi:alpha/beta hydrolase [Catenulispora sp. NL8]|uniref:Alpha/beta hydrolase n=1 Tax=Catenulispora pinistramenti TaxID=2705254 RepID=A0ABS5KYR2_9ACTN|nr:alpha/beta hydrolase [Catenulispora pinistramenti]MBS2551211.1 alpha/beta hydrolase [Catenulispora pinistramenti]